MTYRIRIDPYALKALTKIDPVQRRRLQNRINHLADEPRPPGALMLKGRTGEWRIRVGDYRVVYTIEDDVLLILVVDVGHRRDIYRGR